MTPSMRLTAIKATYTKGPVGDAIRDDLEKAFALGHEFGRDRAADVVDQCNKEGPYNAIGAASRIRALKVRLPENVATVDKDFLA